MTHHDSPSLQHDADYQRINEHLKRVWKDARGSAPYPGEDAVTLDAITPIRESCFLVKHAPGDAPSFSYVFLGSELIEAYGGGAEEREACERLAFPSSDALRHQFMNVISSGAPLEDEGSFVNTQGLTIRYRSVMLPLADASGERVGFIIGGMRWKSFL